MARFTVITGIDGDWSRRALKVADGNEAIRLALENMEQQVSKRPASANGMALIGECENDFDPVQWIGAWLWRAGEGFAWSQDDEARSQALRAPSSLTPN